VAVSWAATAGNSKDVVIWSLVSSNNATRGGDMTADDKCDRSCYRLRMCRVRRNSRQHDVSPLPVLASSDMFSVRWAKSTRSANTCEQSKHIDQITCIAMESYSVSNFGAKTFKPTQGVVLRKRRVTCSSYQPWICKVMGI